MHNSKKVYVNIAPTLLYGGNTGIQRVARELRRHLDKRVFGDCEYEFGALLGGRWFAADNFGSASINQLSHPSLFKRVAKYFVPQRFRSAGRRLLTLFQKTLLQVKRVKGRELKPSDLLIDIDAGWVQQWEANGNLDATRITLVHDLIPITHGQYFTRAHCENFRRWLNKALMSSVAIISVSRSAMETVRDYAQQLPGAKVTAYGFFHHGSNFNTSDEHNATSLSNDLSHGQYFLIVGTIEPRKNHQVLFDAFDAYRKHGGNWSLVIVGREGENCEGIIRGMKSSPYFGNETKWFNNADDVLLAHLYRSAGALVIPSHIEGFGLPLIEGAHWGCPVIASDIPVFREIGDPFANFFSPTDVSQLESLLWQADHGTLKKKPSRDVSISLNWEQSALQFAAEIERLIRS